MRNDVERHPGIELPEAWPSGHYGQLPLAETGEFNSQEMIH